jgi:hypothetical protein
MFGYVRKSNGVEMRCWQINGLNVANGNAQSAIGGDSRGNRVELDSVHFPAKLLHPAHEISVAATGIEQVAVLSLFQKPNRMPGLRDKKRTKYAAKDAAKPALCFLLEAIVSIAPFQNRQFRRTSDT